MTDKTDASETGRANWIAERDPVTGRITKPIPKTPDELAEIRRIRSEGIQEAKFTGLIAAANRLQLDFRDAPATIAAIVEALAVRAVESENGRAANEAAEIILKTVGILTGRAGEAPGPVSGLRLEVDSTIARELLDRLAAKRAGG